MKNIKRGFGFVLFLLGFGIFLYVLFFGLGYAYHYYLFKHKKDDYFLSVSGKLYAFHKSNSLAADAPEIFKGNDWDRICFLYSHKANDLEKIIDRELTFKEWIFWLFRVDFVDFDSDSGVLIFEKESKILGLSHSPVFISWNSQGCYSRNELQLQKITINSSPYKLNFRRKD